MRALSIAATGMSAQQTNLDVIANNIANINTTAFKRARAASRPKPTPANINPRPSNATTTTPPSTTGVSIASSQSCGTARAGTPPTPTAESVTYDRGVDTASRYSRYRPSPSDRSIGPRITTATAALTAYSFSSSERSVDMVG